MKRGEPDSSASPVAATVAAPGALAYEPRPHPGPVLIVRSESVPVGPALDPMLGWRAYAENIESVSVPGFGHEGAFSPAGCRVMAAKISLMACR